MPGFLASKRTPAATLRQRFPDAVILDVTSRAQEPWVRFSPFFPHGNLPVPFSGAQLAFSVEGIWQGLKVFEHEDIDPAKFKIGTMKNLKRPANAKRGKVLGHRKGLGSRELLDYAQARELIYIPSYRYVLMQRLQSEVRQLQELMARDVVFLDYNTNADIRCLHQPLSHAALILDFLAQPNCV